MSLSNDSSSNKEDKSASLVIRACDMCRKKKIRCEVISDVCAQCIKYKTKCHFTPISVKRSPRRSPGSKRVEELEKKLRWMEEQLKLALETCQSTPDSPLRNESEGLGTPSSSQYEASSSDLAFSDVPWDSAYTTAGDYSRTIDFGPPFQASPSGMGTGSDIAITPWVPSFMSEFTGRALKPLPQRDKTLGLIKKSFKNFYSAFPLFDEAAFLSTFKSADTHVNDPSWWVCLNVVLALTYRFCDQTSQDRDEDDHEAWEYFQNALSAINQLMTMQYTLWSVQALLGMALVIQGTPNQGPLSVLTSSAIKLAQRMDLHRQYQDPSFSKAEIEERKRVFWIAYCLDKDITLQTGQPPAQDDDDMDVELPSEYDDAATYPGKSTDMNIFYFRVKLAMIQGQIYKRLCSVKTTKQTVDERIQAARELGSMLQTWRASVPIEYIREYCGSDHQVQASNASKHPVILQLAYFNSLSVVYGALPTLPMYHEIRPPGDPVDIRIMSAPLIQATEARKAIKLLQVTPRRKNTCVWAVLHTFISAATTLLTHALSNTSDLSVLSDLPLIEPLIKMLETLSKSGQSEKATELYNSCLELYEKAKIVAEGYGDPDTGWGQFITSAQSAGKDSVEEFLHTLENVSPGYDVAMGSIYPGLSREFALAIGDQFDEFMYSEGRASDAAAVQ